MDRKEFLKNSALAGGSFFLLSGFNESRAFSKETEPSFFRAEEIDEFVGAAHSDLEKTEKIIKAKPLILNCTSQLAKGDFETAMGGASHMGRKDIAELLLSQGARMDIFNFTFFGFTSFVKNLLQKYPNLLNSYGPHGFTLLHHAKVGGHSNFAKWLKEQGLKKEIFDDIYEW